MGFSFYLGVVVLAAPGDVFAVILVGFGEGNSASKGTRRAYRCSLSI